MTAADVLVECLMDWGVDVIFGLPGDGINGNNGGAANA
jgi:pyruvate dehydrogenase (quinone)